MSGTGNPYVNAIPTGINPVAQANNGQMTAQQIALIQARMQAQQQQQMGQQLQQPTQAMGAAPQGQQANMNAPYGGVSNAGNQVLNAYLASQQMQNQSPENQALQQRYGMSSGQVGNIINPNSLNNLFSFGGGGS